VVSACLVISLVFHETVELFEIVAAAEAIMQMDTDSGLLVRFPILAKAAKMSEATRALKETLAVLGTPIGTNYLHVWLKRSLGSGQIDL